ncbi:hypothetical protein NM208_g237 [Fusarium decemcellulare]|uniref:Uncharacterized protein n=1 Tax=Fusarium decemcellulare TaxID=57161 RepID=A0ACC1T003_9HYPO|nr:hypothetical protein NM208_g237 [Fusarium decemcellulare]
MANIDRRTGTDVKAPMEIDPSAPGSIVRIILAAESALNIFMAIPIIFNAKEALGRMYLSDGKSAAPHAASVFQLFGLSLVAMTVPMVLAIPNKTGAVERRRTTYQMLASFEAFAVPLSFWQAWVAGEADSGLDPSKVIWGFGLPIGLALGFRAWVLFVKPEWMGKYRAKRMD